MSDEAPLKTAYELAMERLRARDREEGVAQPRALSAEQKREISRLRQATRAKLAEREILQRKNVADAKGDPAKLAEAEEHYRIDRRRAESGLEEAIARVKQGSSD